MDGLQSGNDILLNRNSGWGWCLIHTQRAMQMWCDTDLSSTSPENRRCRANSAAFPRQSPDLPKPRQPPQNIDQMNFPSLPINSAISPYLYSVVMVTTKGGVVLVVPEWVTGFPSRRSFFQKNPANRSHTKRCSKG
jgi:hypothetical protein